MKNICCLLFLSGVLLLCDVCKGRTDSNATGNLQKSSEDTACAFFRLVNPLPNVPEKMMVYKTITPDISREYITRLMNLFDLKSQIIDQQRQFMVRDQDRVIEIFKEPGTGYLRYCNDARLVTTKEARNLPSEDEAIKMAEDFLKTNNLLPENIFFVGVGYSEIRNYASNGETVSQGRTSIAVGFGFIIDGMKVTGPGAKASVVFGDDGEIIEVSKIWREIEPDKEKKIKTPEEAFAEFKQRWPDEADAEQFEKALIKTKVNISETYLTYYAEPGCIPQMFIEPVYVFKGVYQISRGTDNREIVEEDKFVIIIPAISKE